MGMGMGIGIHECKFLQKIAKKYEFKKTLTIGRQQIFFDGEKCIDSNKKIYCEDFFLNNFKSSSVDSIDISDYEGANIVHDLNIPILNKHYYKYDTIYDGGALEHIFDIKTALFNISKMLNNNGNIIHIVPANNQCGHGFYQFSPELFFSFYSKNLGYSSCDVYLAVEGNYKSIYQVIKPENGIRNSFKSVRPVHLIVVARKEMIDYQILNNNYNLLIQQSDYVYNWNNFRINNNYLKNFIKSNKLLLKICYPIYRFIYNNVLIWVTNLNPMLIKINY
jgi:hypothetical protein